MVILKHVNCSFGCDYRLGAYGPLKLKYLNEMVELPSCPLSSTNSTNQQPLALFGPVKRAANEPHCRLILNKQLIQKYLVFGIGQSFRKKSVPA
jgi:hypothetical protein